MAESEEELKIILITVKDESEKVGLRLNIQKTLKIMASGPITSWQIDGETVETVADFIWGGCFPGGSEVKVSASNAGDLGSIPGSGRSPGEGNGNLLLPGESHGRRSLVGYSPRGHKESDTTEDFTFVPYFTILY